MQKNIDPRVLMTVIAFQGDRENWRRQQDDRDRDNKSRKNNIRAANALSDQSTDVAPEQLEVVMENINAISKKEGLTTLKEPPQDSLEAIANELENNFNSTQATDDENETSKDRISSFTDYCLNLVQSNAVSDTKKKAILYLLKMRLASEAK